MRYIKLFEEKDKDWTIFNQLKIGDYIQYYHPAIRPKKRGKILNIKILDPPPSPRHKGKVFYIQTLNDIDVTTLYFEKIRFLTKDEIERFEIENTAKKYNL